MAGFIGVVLKLGHFQLYTVQSGYKVGKKEKIRK